ncbi:VWA-like domain-containing protein [uncultured Limosilactobacillus sp.]|uniref:vWA domain-containing protein n=1 Tax=uncultured Limosilactobacillus sp. TaxID=2837629 RepID=UPI0025CEA76F|nr:VWA-like domain-containing protein [uncultured Limosilactobacillus sp.]
MADQLTQLFKQLAASKNAEQRQRLAAQYVAAGVVAILKQRRLVGEVLLALPKKVAVNSPGTFALAWKDSNLLLLVQPAALMMVDPDQLISLLNHEAMHVIWRHPLRYSTVADQANVKAACDIAVNQYLSQPPAGTATLTDLRQLIRQPVKSGQDSADYLRIIRQNHVDFNGKLKNPGQPLSGNRPQKRQSRPRPGKPKVPGDSHRGWLVEGEEAGRFRLQKTARLQRLLTSAWQKTPAKQRGLVPGMIERQLRSDRHRSRPRWVRQLSLWLGTVPHGTAASRARFNRRQPYRMELPGRITRYVTRLLVFVDNSGSMGDDEIAHLLDQVNFIAQSRSIAVTILPFDAAVHPEGRQELSGGHQVDYRRSGGGGTSFQSVFDYLSRQRVSKESLILIMTDGWGEQVVHDNGYRRLIWLLTTKQNELSVTHPTGRVIVIGGEPNWSN